MLAWYQARLVARPFTTNVVSATGLMCVGDVVAQRIERAGRRESSLELEKPSWVRTAVMSSYSAIIYTPYVMWVYSMIARRFGPVKRLSQAVLQATASNVAIAVPLNSVLFAYSSVLENILIGNPEDVKADIERKFSEELLPLAIRSAQIWIPATSLNFYFFKPKHRVLVMSLVSVGWNVYTSIVNHRFGDGGDNA